MQNGSYSHSRWIVFVLAVLTGLSFFWIGCGQKGPPRPPHRPLPPAVKDLSYVVYNQIVELSWTIPDAEGRKASPPAAVKVFRSRLTAEEASCENCPVRYSASADIPIHQKRSEKSKPIRMSHTEFIEPGYRYLYKVIVFDEYGISGKDSNVVKFDH
jgi:hypothetical protein